MLLHTESPSPEILCSRGIISEKVEFANTLSEEENDQQNKSTTVNEVDLPKASFPSTNHVNEKVDNANIHRNECKYRHRMT